MINHEDLIHIDIETRSYIDLKKHGVYVYADINYTDILIFCYGPGNDPVKEWWPCFEIIPDDLLGYLKDPNRILAAHNASFERLLLNRVGPKYNIPYIPIERWYCTLYQMAVNNIPMSLKDAGRALQTNWKKSPRGETLIRLLSNPREDGTFNEDMSLYQEFMDYCVIDVETERNISQVTRMVSDLELEDYWTCEHINDAGIQVDHALARKAVTLADEIAENAETEMEQLTKGKILKARGPKLTQWVYEQIGGEGQVLMTKQVKDKKTNTFVEKKTLDRNAREALMQWPGLKGVLREVVELAESVGSGSVKKFTAMINGMEPDGRVRGSYLCGGAPATGRYSARRIQMHNFSRDTYKNPEPIIKRFLETGELPDSPMLSMKRLLRPALMAKENHQFVCSDWSAIEGRALPWLADDPDCEPKLDLFRSGKCVYLSTASDIYKEEVTLKTDPRRQVGKVAELALGFGGSIGSFTVMGANYGIYLSENEIYQIVNRWRSTNPGIVRFWARLNLAAMKAVDRPGTSFEVGRVAFLFNEKLLNGTLWCRLPSGRLLSYTHCSIDYNPKFDSYGLSALNATVSPAADATEWTRRNLYGGLFSENITQAACADLLRDVLRDLVKKQHPVIAHTHDEALLEVPTSETKEYLEILEHTMLNASPWAVDLPLAVESWIGPRYRK